MKKDNLGNIFGGLAAALVALPSSIAYGLIIYSPLGTDYSGNAALAGILGTAVIGITAAIIGGAPGLISAPCAPAAAVLSVFTLTLINSGSFPLESIPFAITIVAAAAGLLQLAAGTAGGGKIIKYIPYPVVAGYMTGVGLLIIIGQLPKMTGLPKGSTLMDVFTKFSQWDSISAVVAIVTIIVMFLAGKFIKLIPAAIVSICAGVGAYFILGAFNPELLVLADNHHLIGTVSASPSEIAYATVSHYKGAALFPWAKLNELLIPALTLAVLLSIDSLKTCVVLDALTKSRHNSNRVLIGQGLGNLLCSAAGGIPGAGTMGATLVNINSGGRSNISGVIMGIFSILALLLLGGLLSWIPLPALAGVLIVVGYRMMDFESLKLLKHRSTLFDFFVIISVVIAAVTRDLILAASVGIFMAILLFIREQIRLSVISRKYSGKQIFSKKRRLPSEIELLEKEGEKTAVFELQGQLFFGTADQLMTEMEPYISKCRFLILDMRRVRSLDYTAANMLRQISQRIKDKNGILLLSSVPMNLPGHQNISEYLTELGFTQTALNFRNFSNLDSALEWTEDYIIRENVCLDHCNTGMIDLVNFEFFKDVPVEAMDQLKTITNTRKYNKDSVIFRKGEQSDEIFFIRSGTVKILLPIEGGKTHHLGTFSQGDFFGDMAFLDKAPRSADAVTDDITNLYVLTRDEFKILSKQYPEVNGLFYKQLARAVSLRLRQNHAEIAALEES